MFERLVKAFTRIRNFWCQEESSSIGEFINRIADPGSKYNVTIILRCASRSAGDNTALSAYTPITYHYQYYFVAQAISQTEDQDVVFSRYIGDGNFIFIAPDLKKESYEQASLMEDQAIEEVRDLRARINRRLPNMKVEIIQKNGIFSEDKIIS